MLALLRKIRLKTLKTKKFYSYIAYAVGEIVLVVIGILLALYINNRSQEFEAKKKSELCLKNMVLDLATDTLYLGKIIPKIQESLNSQQLLLEMTNITEKDKYAIVKAVSPVNFNFSINDKTFQNIQNSEGKLFGYEQLNKDISNYYLSVKKTIDYYIEMELKWQSTPSAFETVVGKNLFLNAIEFSDPIQFSTMHNLKITYVPEVKTKIGNFDKIAESLKEIETLNYLNTKFTRFNHIVFILTMTKINAVNLIEQINTQLKP